MATATLDFEKPIFELERQIDELKKLAGERQLNVAQEIAPEAMPEDTGALLLRAEKILKLPEVS